MSAKLSFTIERRLNAAPQKVYEAWTEPKKIAQWWGLERAEVLHAEADVRVGGRFRKITQTPDGKQHEVSGVYREVVPGEKLVFSWAWRTTPEKESLVTVTFRGDGAGTVLTLTHEQLYDEHALGAHRRGWIEALGRLADSFR